MDASLEPLLPALDNPSVFTVVAVLLIALVIGSIVTRSVQFSEPSNLRWLTIPRRSVAIATWVLLTFWLGIGTAVVVFAGAVGGSLLIVVVGIVTFLIAFPLLTIWLLAWFRGRAWADWLTLTLVAGFCVIVGTTQRLWICEPLAWGGFSSAQMCTARLYAEGSQGAIQDIDVAASWYGQAALNGSEEAVRRLISVTPNRHTQRRHLEKASLAGNAAAMYHLSVLLGQPEGLHWLNMAIEMRQADALYQKSRYLQTGEHGYRQNAEIANDLLREAAERGSPAAAAELSLAYETGMRPFGYSRSRSSFWEVRVDDQWPGYGPWLSRLERQRRLRDRVSQGDPTAMLELARFYQSNAGTDPASGVDARRWLAQSAEAGSAEAQFELAFIHFKRADVTAEEMADARRWLTDAANQQHQYALSNISHYLTNGQYGFEVNLDLATAYARTLVARLATVSPPKAGDLKLAQERLERAERLLEAQATWEDGLGELEVRASAGEADALYQLYEKHVGDNQRGDRTLAESLLRSAAEHGHLESRYRLANRTLSQPRTPAEEAQAYEWMKDAAEEGHRGALVFMGRIHLRGLPKYGIEKDANSARSLLERALEGLEGNVVYARRSGSVTVSTMRQSVERLLAELEASSDPS